MKKKNVKLNLYSANEYIPIDDHDPLKFYFVPGFKHLYRERLIRCLSECRKGKRILEVGFGSGLTFPNLKEMYPFIFGLEKNDPQIISKIEKQFSQKNISVYLTSGNLLNLPYDDGEFDTVLAISVLEHLYPEQQDRAFSELFRVLRINGQLVYGVPIEHPLMTFLYRVLGYQIKNFHFSDQDTIRKTAQKTFKTVQHTNLDVLGISAFSVYQVVNCLK
jgi:ubiquinone/menaquinone biosynthesis C-methylase UbiE